MIISEKERKRVNELVSIVRKEIAGMEWPSAEDDLEDRRDIADSLLELHSIVLRGLGQARIYQPSCRAEVAQLENPLTERFTSFSKYRSFEAGLAHSIRTWLASVSEAIALIEAVEQNLQLVSRGQYEELLQQRTALKERNEELEKLILNISAKPGSLVFSVPELKAIAQTCGFSSEVQEEIARATEAYKSGDLKGALRAMGVAGEKLTEDQFVSLFGQQEAEKTKTWESRLMKIHSYSKDKDTNLHILVADTMLVLKWLRDRADHPMGYKPNDDDLNTAFACLGLAMRKYGAGHLPHDRRNAVKSS